MSEGSVIGEMEGEIKGGEEFLKMSINRDFVRVKGRDEGFLITSTYFSITCL